MRTVKDILRAKGDNVVSIEKTKSVFDAIMLMDTHHIGSLMVMEQDDLVGVLTERDYACKVTIQGKQAKTTTVSDIMTKQLVVANYNTSLNECMALMTNKRVRHLPVIERGKLVGLVSIGDVVKEIIDEQNFVIEQLESYIHS